MKKLTCLAVSCLLSWALLAIDFPAAEDGILKVNDAKGISGLPTLRVNGEPSSAWVLSKRGDRLLFDYRNGMMILIR